MRHFEIKRLRARRRPGRPVFAAVARLDVTSGMAHAGLLLVAVAGAAMAYLALALPAPAPSGAVMAALSAGGRFAGVSTGVFLLLSILTGPVTVLAGELAFRFTVLRAVRRLEPSELSPAELVALSRDDLSSGVSHRVAVLARELDEHLSFAEREELGRAVRERLAQVDRSGGLLALAERHSGFSGTMSEFGPLFALTGDERRDAERLARHVALLLDLSERSSRGPDDGFAGSALADIADVEVSEQPARVLIALSTLPSWSRSSLRVLIDKALELPRVDRVQIARLWDAANGYDAEQALALSRLAADWQADPVELADVVAAL